MGADESKGLGRPVDRSLFVGGSDVAAILGVSPWKTPYELWLEKMGRAIKEEIDPARQKRFDRGHRLEPIVLDMLIDRLKDEGRDVELIRRNEYYTDAEHPFMKCEIDFELMLDGEHVNGDCKTVHPFAAKKWGEELTDEVPIEYAAQFMHGLGITGRRRCIVATLIGMDDFLIYEIERDDETISGIRSRVVQFWNECVLADMAPDPIDFDDARTIYAKADGTSIEADTETRDAVFQLADVKRRIKLLEEQEEDLSFRIVDFMRPHAFLKVGGHDLCSWKNQNDTRLDQKALEAELPEVFAKFRRTKEIRVLRLKKQK
ncbi:YqaJ viral recombinase family protein [Pararobbsia alpina]|uniref:YqaJ viral recombinase domain-containing protein n=1 Tax=Pararobbsia alpina TaxID=621374 RepID=A0A6S7C9Y4_9BURK|nr:YqaJ viral recombinase family protein [Pararobbsia alpina]CAB3784634.1 hypothetical protein LMG28138_01848 [Pararobbsia alpina]